MNNDGDGGRASGNNYNTFSNSLEDLLRRLEQEIRTGGMSNQDRVTQTTRAVPLGDDAARSLPSSETDPNSGDSRSNFGSHLPRGGSAQQEQPASTPEATPTSRAIQPSSNRYVLHAMSDPYASSYTVPLQPLTGTHSVSTAPSDQTRQAQSALVHQPELGQQGPLMQLPIQQALPSTQTSPQALDVNAFLAVMTRLLSEGQNAGQLQVIYSMLHAHMQAASQNNPASGSAGQFAISTGLLPVLTSGHQSTHTAGASSPGSQMSSPLSHNSMLLSQLANQMQATTTGSFNAATNYAPIAQNTLPVRARLGQQPQQPPTASTFALQQSIPLESGLIPAKSTLDTASSPASRPTPTTTQAAVGRRRSARLAEEASANTPKSGPPKKQACGPEPFPERLYRLLIEVEAEGRSNLISWQPDGRSFRLHNVARFCREIVPEYFRQAKFRSFKRQLSNYDFRRRYHSQILPDIGGSNDGNDYEWYHENFIRGRPDLLNRVRRVARVASSEAKAAESKGSGATGGPKKPPPKPPPPPPPPREEV